MYDNRLVRGYARRPGSSTFGRLRTRGFLVFFAGAGASAMAAGKCGSEGKRTTVTVKARAAAPPDMGAVFSAATGQEDMPPAAARRPAPAPSVPRWRGARGAAPFKTIEARAEFGSADRPSTCLVGRPFPKRPSSRWRT